MQMASDRISLGSSQELRTGIAKNLEEDLHARTPNRISQDRHKRTCYCCWSGSDKILIQEPPKSLHKSFHTSTSKAWMRNLLMDLLERIPPGSPQDLLLKTCAGSRKDLWERNSAGSPQEPIYNENAADQELENPAQSKCTWTCQQTILCKSSQGKYCAPTSWCTPCASLRSGNALGHVTTTILCENLQEKTGSQMEHPDQAPAFSLTERIPQCGRTVGSGKQIQFHKLKSILGWFQEFYCSFESSFGCSSKSVWT